MIPISSTASPAYIRVTKVLAKPECPNTLHLGYWIEGFAATPPMVGEPFVVDRRIRNGLKILGTFTTSPVTYVNENIFHTENSVYRIDPVEVLE